MMDFVDDNLITEFSQLMSIPDGTDRTTGSLSYAIIRHTLWTSILPLSATKTEA